MHNNPVEEEIVFKTECYVYSSVIDYAGEKGAECYAGLILLPRDVIVWHLENCKLIAESEKRRE